MPLSNEQKQVALISAKKLAQGDWTTYRKLRDVIRNQLPTNSPEPDVIMAIIFNLLPRNSQDTIAVQLMSEAVAADSKR